MSDFCRCNGEIIWSQSKHQIDLFLAWGVNIHMWEHEMGTGSRLFLCFNPYSFYKTQTQMIDFNFGLFF